MGDSTNLLKTMDEIVEKAKKLGALCERTRIMEELLKANLPLGVWSMIKEIIKPIKDIK